ncbi:MAG: hypothetical protein PHE55_06385 [Methylococcaceae bacterium]|nr:hypothetical protein [Methylococcaceae bacterium]
MNTRTIPLLCALLWATAAPAEPPKGDAAMLQTLRKAQGLLRQVSQEKTELEAKNAELQEKLKTLEARASRVEPLENEVRQHKTALETLRGETSSLQSRIQADSEQMRGLSERRKKTIDILHKYKQDNQFLVNAVAERGRWIEACTGKNRQLHQANREMLEQFDKRGFWENLKSAEPLSGIGSVAEENRAQEFQFKLDDLQVTPWQEQKPAAPNLQAQPGDEEEE